MKLRDSEKAKEDMISTFEAMKGILLDKDMDYANEFISWMYKKLIDTYHDSVINELNEELKKYNNKSDEDSLIEIKKIKQKRKKFMPSNYPSYLQVGDIVHINFGSGYCAELSDGHYGVILTDRIGSMYLVVPLTSTKPKGKILYYDDLDLPSKDGVTDSYILFNQIRFMSYRRLENISGVENGRKHLKPERVKEILDILFKEVINFSVDENS